MLSRTDPAQTRVLEHRRGVLLAVGGPGTGKTTALCERFARLIEGGADPERVALVVRTSWARASATERLRERLGRSLPALQVLSVHALANHVVSRRLSELGYREPPTILSATEQLGLVAELLAHQERAAWPVLGAMLRLKGFADQMRQFVLRAQEALLDPGDLGRRAARAGLAGWDELARFYAEYLDVLDQQGVVDFAGIVRAAAAALRSGDGSGLFDHVMVDDYQEATSATEAVVSSMRSESLVVAGDAGSHVFSFQGTTDRPLREFELAFPEHEHVELTTRHRPAAEARAWTVGHPMDEHLAATRWLRERRQDGISWSEMAIVVRRDEPELASLSATLDEFGIPWTAPDRGLLLLTDRATRPFILALRWLAHPAERDALAEAVLTSELGRCSPAEARGLIRSTIAGGGSPAEALGAPAGGDLSDPAGLATLRRVLDEAGAVAGRSAPDAFRLLWRELPFSHRLVEHAGDSPRGRRDLAAVVALSGLIERAAERPDASVAAVLESLESSGGGPGAGPGSNGSNGVAGPAEAVRILTAHAAAGREFDTVVVVGATEGNFPSLRRPEPLFDLANLDGPLSQADRNRIRLEDERRLFRMVVSRASGQVVLLAGVGVGGEPGGELGSRFATELGVEWEPAPEPSGPEPLTVAEAAAGWRRTLADAGAPAAERLACLDGLRALGVDPTAWWFQRDWTGNEGPLHEDVHVSYSRLDTLENCALQFVLDHELGLGGASGYQAWAGHLVHTIIEECESGQIRRDPEALAAEADRRWDARRFPSLAVSEAYRRLVIERALPAWFREFGAAGPAAARERRFEFEFAGAAVIGFIDRIGGLQGGGSCITDYKTGRSRSAPPAAENLQLAMYFLAVELDGELEAFRPVREVELVFLREQDWRTGGVKRVFKTFGKSGGDVAEYRAASKDRLRGLIERTGDLMRREDYSPNPLANCRFCEFKPLCSLWPEGREVFPVAGR